MNLPNGKYTATATAASVNESKGGALMVAIAFDITTEGHETESIIAYECLKQKSGTVSVITYEMLRKCFGWGGVDPFELQDLAESGALREKPVELVIEAESYTATDGTQKIGPKVRYINPPGGLSGKLPESGDRAAINAKHGASLRAMSGSQAPVNTNTRSVNSAPNSRVHPSRPAPVDAPAPAPSPAAGGCTKDVAWAAACETCHGLSDPELNEKWFNTIAALFPGRTEQSLSPVDWARVRGEFDEVPF